MPLSRDGEKVQHLEALFALAEDLDLIPSIYMDAHNCL